MDEMVPPWEMFPTYDFSTIGWRMGVGEDYLHRWWPFVRAMPDEASRLAYLQRHRPAPVNWAEHVLLTLNRERAVAQNNECTPEDRVRFIAMGLVEYDVAYRTWLQQQTEIIWPWLWDEPIDAARYRTRELWFSARQLLEQREAIAAVTIPPEWEAFAFELRTGQLGPLDPTRGLHTLVQMLCAGTVLPPWLLALSPESFRDTFDLDMGFADAYRLWVMSAFDDDGLLHQMFHLTGIPAEWQAYADKMLVTAFC